MNGITYSHEQIDECLRKQKNCSKFLDFSKAFVTVDHDILLQKLHRYGIRGYAYIWFKSYLTHKTQFVAYNGAKSKKLEIKYGVLQGSILGPLLFLIYISNLHTVCK